MSINDKYSDFVHLNSLGAKCEDHGAGKGPRAQLRELFRTPRPDRGRQDQPRTIFPTHALRAEGSHPIKSSLFYALAHVSVSNYRWNTTTLWIAIAPITTTGTKLSTTMRKEMMPQDQHASHAGRRKRNARARHPVHSVSRTG